MIENLLKLRQQNPFLLGSPELGGHLGTRPGTGLTSEMGGPTSEVREQAWARFEKLGVPTKRNEDWIYTSLKPLNETAFHLSVKQDLAGFNLGAVTSPEFSNFIFINGNFSASHSDKIDGVSIQSTTTAQGGGETANSATSHHASLKSLAEASWMKPLDKIQAFEALNLSFQNNPVEIQIPAGKIVDKPVHLVFLVTEDQVMTQPRVRVTVGEGAKLTLIESYVGSAAQTFQNAVTEIEVQKFAVCEYVRLQNEDDRSFHVGLTRFNLGEKSKVNSVVLSLGGQIARQELEVYLNQPAADAECFGISLGHSNQHHDHSTLIDHVVGECTTDQLYKSVLAGKSRSAFTGKVMIRKHAQKASSQQLNNNLLLSREAEADSRPQLEILADDVKATHGSTVGQLDPEELFYLQSRGISKGEAQEFLSLGFVQEIVDKITDLNVRKLMSATLLKRYQSGVGSTSAGGQK